ncbi:DUF6030 family protein [Sphingomonas sp. HT-1]|uniref:DUF6030 family protein n=1 Tax=unclassified Sphingomonas TaxID=196159 RepID=UPI0002FBE64E|nr:MULTISPECIES: DUF6030 family protein [unclassified Sphingomonas]KTF68163.1 hypothetical protein ATB93_01500 [Sphingomonas sp. WG]
MLARVALPVALVGLLAACKPAAQPQPAEATPTPAATPTASPIPVVFEKGWPEFWRDPANAIDVLNRTGARIGDYRARPGGRVAESMPTALDLKPTDHPNAVTIIVRGDKDRLDTLDYRLDLRQPDQGEAAAKALGEMIVNAFRVLGLPGARDVAEALVAGKDLTKTVDGAAIRLRRTPAPDLGAGLNRITVTFSRTGASAPANS